MTHDAARRTDTNPTPKTKLLLVDDDPLIVEFLCLVLTTLYSNIERLASSRG